MSGPGALWRDERGRLFIAVISAHTQARDEGYFRREWNLAVDCTHDMAEMRAFLVPIVIDGDARARGMDDESGTAPSERTAIRPGKRPKPAK